MLKSIIILSVYFASSTVNSQELASNFRTNPSQLGIEGDPSNVIQEQSLNNEPVSDNSQFAPTSVNQNFPVTTTNFVPSPFFSVIPSQTVPVSSFPVSSFPVSSIPVSSFPVSSFPVSSFPAQTQTVPVQSVPIQSTGFVPVQQQRPSTTGNIAQVKPVQEGVSGSSQTVGINQGVTPQRTQPVFFK